MHYLRAAVALVAAMTFSSMAFGETRPAIAIFSAPDGPRALAIEPSNTPSSATYSTSIARYTPVPTLIIGITEYDPLNCKWLDLASGPTPTRLLNLYSKGSLLGR